MIYGMRSGGRRDSVIPPAGRYSEAVHLTDSFRQYRIYPDIDRTALLVSGPGS
jgi:hypothetical protein